MVHADMIIDTRAQKIRPDPFFFDNAGGILFTYLFLTTTLIKIWMLCL